MMVFSPTRGKDRNTCSVWSPVTRRTDEWRSLPRAGGATSPKFRTSRQLNSSNRYGEFVSGSTSFDSAIRSHICRQSAFSSLNSHFGNLSASRIHNPSCEGVSRIQIDTSHSLAQRQNVLLSSRGIWKISATLHSGGMESARTMQLSDSTGG
jgi:hypothetical protein